MDEVAAVVLARGLGTRMRLPAGPGAAALTSAQASAADAGLKVLMPMGDATGSGRPFLDYGLDALADAGFRRVVLVVAPDHDVLRRYYVGAGAPTRLTLAFAVQAEPLGTADAVRAAASAVSGCDFVVVNGDNLYPVEALRTLRALDGPGFAAFERDDLVASSGLAADRVSGFALLDVSPEGRLVDVHEKPSAQVVAAAGPRAAVSMNCWRFDERILQACADVPRSARGEFELTSAVRLAVRRGVVFRAVPARGPVLDLSRRQDVATVAARLAGRRPSP